MSAKCFLYARISDDRSQGLGVARQLEDARELAVSLGYEVLEEIVDNSISAYSGAKRPGYERMLANLADVDAVIIWHSDRLHRQLTELERYVELVTEHEVVTHAVRGGKIDLESHEGIMHAGVMGVLARYESGHRSDRIKRSHAQSAREGRWRGGARPFGWNAANGVLSVNEDEASLVRQAMHDVIAGRSLGAIVRDWNESDVGTTGKSSAWSAATLRQVLRRPSNAGFSVLQGEIVGKLQAGAIVSEDVWRAVCTLLADPSRRRSQTNRARHLLAGIAQCHCGAPVKSATITGRKGERYKVYRCPGKGKGHIGKRTEPVDNVANEMAVVLRNLRSSDAPPSEDDAARVEHVRAELAAKELRLDDIAMQFAREEVTSRQLALATEYIQSEIAELEREMTQLHVRQSNPTPERLAMQSGLMETEQAAEWFALGIDDRRDYLRANFNFILLPHSKGSPRVFDRDTVVAVVNPRSSLLESDEITQILRSIGEADGHGQYRIVIRRD